MADQETRLVNFRLTDDELEMLDRIKRATGAKDRTEALRTALQVAPLGLYGRFMDDMKALSERMRNLAANLDEVERMGSGGVAAAMAATKDPSAMGGYGLDQLKAFAAMDAGGQYGPLRDLAQQELLRRGYFPDGLGNWVENHPELTRLVPTPSLKGPIATKRR